MSPRKPGRAGVEEFPPFATQIKRVRISMGLTQMGFADHLDVSQQTVSYWERGLRRPNRRMWVLLTQRLGYRQTELEGIEQLALPEAKVAEGKSHTKEIALPPLQKGTAAIRVELKGLISEALDVPGAQRSLREALRKGRPVWIVIG